MFTKHVFTLAMLAAMLLGCAGRNSVDYTPSNHPNIQNGIAYESADLTIHPDAILLVPENAIIASNASITKPRLVVVKELSVFGLPTEPISLEQIAPTLGAAQSVADDTHSIATFGEYSVDGHGGATVSLHFFLPASVKWKHGQGLSGPCNVTGPRNSEGSLNPGWHKIATQPTNELLNFK
jgi:hypothetical protein